MNYLAKIRDEAIAYGKSFNKSKDFNDKCRSKELWKLYYLSLNKSYEDHKFMWGVIQRQHES